MILKKIVMALCMLLFPGEVFAASDTGKWPCKDGEHEIPETWKCDSHTDCPDGSDEGWELCPARECEFDEFKCKLSGACISPGLVCNGEFDCFMEDTSDESIELCPERMEEPSETCDFAKEMRCDYPSCIPLGWRCDGEKDCHDGTDEIHCGGCTHGNVSCGDKTGPEDCIDHRWLCDGEEDCSNGSDEKNCPTTTVTVTKATLCKMGEFMCNNGTCLQAQHACDQIYDCKDGEDEGFCGSNTCTERSNPTSWHMADTKSVCDHGCSETPQGPMCFCFSGYVLESDGVRCRTSGSAVPVLFFASNNEILQLKTSPTAPTESFAAIGNHNKNAQIFAIDYDRGQNALLWADHTTGKVHILDRTKQPRLLAKVHGVYGLAHDWVTRNTYVTYKVKRETTGHVALIGFGNNPHGLTKVMKHKFEHIHVTQPMSIAVHPGAGKMVLADSGSALTLSSLILADMDGRNTTTIVTRHVSKIHAVAIDYITNIGYWSESNSLGAQIWMIKFDSLVRKLLVSSLVGDIRFSSPFSISVFGSKLYFSDNSTREIWRVDSLNGKPKGYLHHRHSSILKASRSFHLLGIHITHPALQKETGNLCSTTSCSYFCALRPGGYSCLCPQGLVLEGNNCTEPPSPKESYSVKQKNNLKPWSSGSPVTSNVALPSSKSIVASGEKLSKTCPQPHFASTTPITLKKFHVGFVLYYNCSIGFRVKGSVATSFNTTCKKGGVWDPPPRVCVKLTCDDLSCGENGKCKTVPRQGAICQCRNGTLTYATCSDMSLEANSTKKSSGVTTAILVTLLFVLIVMGLVMWRCMKKREFSRTKHNRSRGPIYTSPVNTSTPTKCIDRAEYLPSDKDQTGISNPNYLSKKKVQLLTHDIADSGVEQSTSPSEDSPGVYNYTSLKQTSDAQLFTVEDKAETLQRESVTEPRISNAGTKKPLLGGRSSLTSMFTLRKTESREHMLPPS